METCLGQAQVALCYCAFLFLRSPLHSPHISQGPAFGITIDITNDKLLQVTENFVWCVTGSCVPHAANSNRCCASLDFFSNLQWPSFLLHRSQSCVHTLLEYGVVWWMQTLPHYENLGHRLANVGVSAQLSWCYLNNIIMLLAQCNCWPCPLCHAWQLLCNHLTGTRRTCWISMYLLLYVSMLVLAHLHL